jgi:hypothetical protein
VTEAESRKMPTVLRVALWLAGATLLAGLVVTFVTAPALVHRLAVSVALLGVAPAAVAAVCLVGVARGKAWARNLLAVLACVEAAFLIAALVQPEAHLGSYLFEVVLVPLRLAAVALLFTAPARMWFGSTVRAVPPQWLPDPTGRHEFRWWDGQHWTGQVASGGSVSQDAAPEPTGVAR